MDDKPKHDVRVVLTNDGSIFIGVLFSETDSEVSLTHLHKIILRTGPNNQSLFYEPFPVVFPEFLTNVDEPFTFNKTNLLHSNLPFDLQKPVTSENHTFEQVFLMRAGLLVIEQTPETVKSEETVIPKLFN